jgi:hypothetical protein
MPKKIKAPEPIDVHIGKRIAAARKVMGLSQEKCADAACVTYQ